jgi:four helix bundle protein
VLGALVALHDGMSRDHRTLRVFAIADRLVIDIYQATKHFPTAERYGLQAQIRRAAVSIATNIVEGCARRGNREYLNFLNIAAGSASEVRYLCDLSHRLGFLPSECVRNFEPRCRELVGSLVRLMESVQVDSET